MNPQTAAEARSNPYPRQARPADACTPFRQQPTSVEETGIDFGQLVDLCVKTIYYAGRPSALRLTEALALPFNVLDAVLGFLKRERYVEVVGATGMGEKQYQYALSDRGLEKAAEAMERNQYVGPAPVPYEAYVEVVLEQSVRRVQVSSDAVDECLKDLVLNPVTHSLIGPAVNSGRSLLLYGDPGNGKSSIARSIGRMLGGDVLIPYAVDVGGQTIKVYDPRVHEAVPEQDDAANGGFRRLDQKPDTRWVRCQRPLILTGGELTLADLELKYSPQARFYTAPLQMKANCGVLVIDDFGRQLLQPKQLLNRWIIPMESRVDYLSLLSGETIELPFELLLVFSTNIPPHRLGDEAFFRRIRHKIEVGDPDEQAFLRILALQCEKNGIPYDGEGGHYLIDRYYRPKQRPFRGVHPRDIVDLILDISSFQKRPPSFTRDWIDLACASYFIDERD